MTIMTKVDARDTRYGSAIKLAFNAIDLGAFAMLGQKKQSQHLSQWERPAAAPKTGRTTLCTHAANSWHSRQGAVAVSQRLPWFQA